MTDYTIPMIIGMALAFTLGAVLGGLWGLSRHEWLYCRVTARLTWRMREAMKSLGIAEWQIDKAQEYMGSVTIPPHIPMPEPPVQEERDFDKEPYTMDEVVRRLSPHDDRGGEWYCTSRQPRMAWRIDKIETTIGSDVDTVLQEVYMTSCGPEDQWQEIIGEKK